MNSLLGLLKEESPHCAHCSVDRYRACVFLVGENRQECKCLLSKIPAFFTSFPVKESVPLTCREQYNKVSWARLIIMLKILKHTLSTSGTTLHDHTTGDWPHYVILWHCYGRLVTLVRKYDNCNIGEKKLLFTECGKINNLAHIRFFSLFIAFHSSSFLKCLYLATRSCKRLNVDRFHVVLLNVRKKLKQNIIDQGFHKPGSTIWSQNKYFGRDILATWTIRCIFNKNRTKHWLGKTKANCKQHFILRSFDRGWETCLSFPYDSKHYCKFDIYDKFSACQWSTS